MNSIVFSCPIVSMEAHRVCREQNGHHDDIDDGMVVHSGPTVTENCCDQLLRHIDLIFPMFWLSISLSRVGMSW